MSNLKYSLNQVIDYNWEDEFDHFMEEHKVEFIFNGEQVEYLKNLKQVIESVPLGTYHILYHLVKLKLFIYEWD